MLLLRKVRRLIFCLSGTCALCFIIYWMNIQMLWKEKESKPKETGGCSLQRFHKPVQRPSQIYQPLHRCPAAWAAGRALSLALHLPSSWQCLELVWGTFLLTPVAAVTAGMVKWDGKTPFPMQPSPQCRRKKLFAKLPAWGHGWRC